MRALATMGASGTTTGACGCGCDCETGAGGGDDAFFGETDGAAAGPGAAVAWAGSAAALSAASSAIIFDLVLGLLCRVVVVAVEEEPCCWCGFLRATTRVRSDMVSAGAISSYTSESVSDPSPRTTSRLGTAPAVALCGEDACGDEADVVTVVVCSAGFMLCLPRSVAMFGGGNTSGVAAVGSREIEKWRKGKGVFSFLLGER